MLLINAQFDEKELYLMRQAISIQSHFYAMYNSDHGKQMCAYYSGMLGRFDRFIDDCIDSGDSEFLIDCVRG